MSVAMSVACVVFAFASVIIIAGVYAFGHSEGVKATEERWSEAVSKAESEYDMKIHDAIHKWSFTRYNSFQLNIKDFTDLRNAILKAVSRKPPSSSPPPMVVK
jgi:hypothetical protein